MKQTRVLQVRMAALEAQLRPIVKKLALVIPGGDGESDLGNGTPGV